MAATALTFAREGAKVLCVDRNLASAEETVAMIRQSQGTAEPFQADVTEDGPSASRRSELRQLLPQPVGARRGFHLA